MKLSTITSDRLPQLRQFLGTAFHGTSSMSFRPDFLEWKYFDPHPWWPGGRSYVFETANGIAAHGCIVPARFLTDAGPVDTMQIIDWAANGLIPGGGLLLYRGCLELSGGTLLAIGGSDDTLRLIPKLKWFTRKEDLRFYARPLRSWRYWNPSVAVCRNLGRMARNLQWQIWPSLPSGGGWRCRTYAGPERIFTPEGDFVPLVRTPEWFEYLMRCPVLATEFVVLECDGIPRGHALLANAGGSFRIADFVTIGGERTDALAALIRYIARNPLAVEVVAGSSLPELWPVFEACGLRLRGTAPVWMADPKKSVPAGLPIEVAPIVGDAYSLYDPGYPFRC